MSRFLPITREDAALFGEVDIFPYTIEPVATETKAKEELNKFFKLAKQRKAEGKDTYMPSCYIDQVWHNMMLNNASYGMFCQTAVGTGVRHVEVNGYGELDWVRDYEVKFHQALPPIWFTDSNGVLDEQAYDTYIETRIIGDGIKMSWNCGPAMDEHIVKMSWDCGPAFVD